MSEFIKLIGNKILVVADDYEEVTDGGIILPTNYSKDNVSPIRKGTVKFIGDDVTDVSVGDVVAYDDRIARKAPIGGIEYLRLFDYQVEVVLTEGVCPLSDRLLIESLEKDEETSGGIIVPEMAREKSCRGKVVFAGPGKKDKKLTAKVGDIVLYGKFTGNTIKIGGKKLMIMRELDIYGILQ